MRVCLILLTTVMCLAPDEASACSCDGGRYWGAVWPEGPTVATDQVFLAAVWENETEVELSDGDGLVEVETTPWPSFDGGEQTTLTLMKPRSPLAVGVTYSVLIEGQPAAEYTVGPDPAPSLHARPPVPEGELWLWTTGGQECLWTSCGAQDGAELDLTFAPADPATLMRVVSVWRGNDEDAAVVYALPTVVERLLLGDAYCLASR